MCKLECVCASVRVMALSCSRSFGGISWLQVLCVRPHLLPPTSLDSCSRA
ncbi:hypothetical protein M758_4G003400 [Ceratodon purpureus]|uniref:Uncharacterized protein n=1 Tax=Ceratodon purpureus TaxID=3225 RepID=A0A8T0I6X5_CERPU|nr:hypothetical protein KC19_4G003600 [Ceratodon purpureus]KAG0617622.1 hypothetical protein M758_4G003400 [Ceratodon purpureus]